MNRARAAAFFRVRGSAPCLPGRLVALLCLAAHDARIRDRAVTARGVPAFSVHSPSSSTFLAHVRRRPDCANAGPPGGPRHAFGRRAVRWLVWSGNLAHLVSRQADRPTHGRPDVLSRRVGQAGQGRTQDRRGALMCVIAHAERA